MGYISRKTIGHKGKRGCDGGKIHAVDNPGKSFLDLLFPKVCAGCKRFGYELCPSCKQNLSKCETDFPLCIVCENLCINGITHKFCSNHTRISKFICDYFYKGTAKRILRQKSVRPEQIKILLKRIKIHPPPDLLIPIPPSPRYLNPRITEPVQIITQHLCIELNVPMYKALYKSPFSKQQKKLSASARQNPGIYLKRDAIQIVKNKRILLIDDVCTTGSTLNSAAKLLKNFHAKEVTAYALARDLRYN